MYHCWQWQGLDLAELEASYIMWWETSKSAPSISPHLSRSHRSCLWAPANAPVKSPMCTSRDKTGWSHCPDFKLMYLMCTTPHGNTMMMRLITPTQWLLCAKYLLQARHRRKCLLCVTSYFPKPLNIIMTFILQLEKKRGWERLRDLPKILQLECSISGLKPYSWKNFQTHTCSYT